MSDNNTAEEKLYGIWYIDQRHSPPAEGWYLNYSHRHEAEILLTTKQNAEYEAEELRGQFDEIEYIVKEYTPLSLTQSIFLVAFGNYADEIDAAYRNKNSAQEHANDLGGMWRVREISLED